MLPSKYTVILMFVSIDMDNLRFAHKHHSHEAVSALGFLEMADRSVRIENADSPHFLSGLSQLDLCILYKNSTGAELVGSINNISASVLRSQLMALVAQLPAVLALPEEVVAQVEAVEDELRAGATFKYALGSKRPAKSQELFPLTAKPLTTAQLTQAATLAPQRVAERAAPVARAATAPRPQPAAASPRAGSVRPTIWAVADRMWEGVGKPTDKGLVLSLRKDIMAHLEEKEGIKRTSSSNELGNWMKARLG